MGDLVNIFVTSFENYLEVGYISLSFFEEKVRRPNRQFATSFVNYLKLDHGSFDFKRMKYMERNALSFEMQGQPISNSSSPLLPKEPCLFR